MRSPQRYSNSRRVSSGRNIALNFLPLGLINGTLTVEEAAALNRGAGELIREVKAETSRRGEPKPR